MEFQKAECLVKTVKKCIMKKLSIWLALIKVVVWGINYQKGQCIYKGIYFILFFFWGMWVYFIYFIYLLKNNNNNNNNFLSIFSAIRQMPKNKPKKMRLETKPILNKIKQTKKLIIIKLCLYNPNQSQPLFGCWETLEQGQGHIFLAKVSIRARIANLELRN